VAGGDGPVSSYYVVDVHRDAVVSRNPQLVQLQGEYGLRADTLYVKARIFSIDF
jgi:hypothetical protein